MELLNDRFRKANLQVGTLNNQQCHKLYLDVIQLLVAREKFYFLTGCQVFPGGWWVKRVTQSDVPKTS